MDCHDRSPSQEKTMSTNTVETKEIKIQETEGETHVQGKGSHNR
jgi:hypothetical protein